MQLTLEIGVDDHKVFCDYQLLVNQVKGVYKDHDETINRYLARSELFKTSSSRKEFYSKSTSSLMLKMKKRT